MRWHIYAVLLVLRAGASTTPTRTRPPPTHKQVQKFDIRTYGMCRHPSTHCTPAGMNVSATLSSTPSHPWRSVHRYSSVCAHNKLPRLKVRTAQGACTTFHPVTGWAGIYWMNAGGAPPHRHRPTESGLSPHPACQERAGALGRQGGPSVSVCSASWCTVHQCAAALLPRAAGSRGAPLPTQWTSAKRASGATRRWPVATGKRSARTCGRPQGRGGGGGRTRYKCMASVQAHGGQPTTTHVRRLFAVESQQLLCWQQWVDC